MCCYLLVGECELLLFVGGTLLLVGCWCCWTSVGVGCLLFDAVVCGCCLQLVVISVARCLLAVVWCKFCVAVWCLVCCLLLLESLLFCSRWCCCVVVFVGAVAAAG